MERIGNEVERTLRRSGRGNVLALAEITSAWPKAVGEAVARQAWPLRLARDGTLHVAAASSTWAFELDRLAPEISERLRVLLGAPAPMRLRFRVGPVPEPGGRPDENQPDRSPPSSPEDVAEAETVAAEIQDPELRALVERAARASFSRARSGRRFW
jgi:hypothetical protein